MTLRESTDLAGRNLVSSLAPSGERLPVLGMEIAPGGAARRLERWPSRNVGRWQDALLQLQTAATGFPIPAWAEEAMSRNLQAYLAGPLELCGHLCRRRAASPMLRTPRGGSTGSLLVRILRWVPEDSIAITADGRPLRAAIVRGCLRFPRLQTPARVRFVHALPRETTVKRIDGVDTG